MLMDVMESQCLHDERCRSSLCSCRADAPRQLTVTEKVHWLVLKVECLHHDNKDEDQNPANEEDLNEDCLAPESVLKL